MSQQCNPDIVARAPAEEREYLSRRAEHHRQLADKSGEAYTRNIHLRLNELYRNQIELIDVVYKDQSNVRNY